MIDYKTGAVPKKPDIEAAIAVQLPLEGAIAAAGGFGIAAGPVVTLEHWRLGGGNPAGKREPAAADAPALIERVLAEITAHIARFDNPATPYRPVPLEKWRPLG